LALIWIGIFGALVLALFSFVYWSTATYVQGGSDRAIAAEQMILRKVYDSTGRRGLIAAIEDRIADERLEGSIYLLAEGRLDSSWFCAIYPGQFGRRDRVNIHHVTQGDSR